MKRSITSLLAVLLIAGCNFTPKAKPTAKPGELTALWTAMGTATTATATADTAAAAAAKAEAERAAKVKANAEHAKVANEGNAEGPAKTVVDGDLTVILALLDDVTADPAELAARARDALLVEAGKVAEARASYASAVQDAQAKASALAVAKAEAEQARIERDAAIAAAKTAADNLATQLEANRIANQATITAAIAKAKDEERKKMLRWLAWTLLGLGIAGVVVAGATMYLTKGAEWERAAIAAGAGVGCFSLYWTMNQPWFAYLVWAVGIGFVGAVGWYLWRESRQHEAIQSKEVRATQADEAEETLQHFIAVTDRLPESTPLSEVITAIQKDMDSNHKALLDELRAESKRTST